MYQKNCMIIQNNEVSSQCDIDVLSDSDMIFTPSTMIRMENSLMGLDGAFDSDMDSFSDDSSEDASASSSTAAKRQKTTSRTPRQLPGPKSSRRLEDMTPEEISRRQRRRERNKAAAARCRQRRLDITNQLLTETQQLESEGQRLEREIENLRRQRDQLQFVLEAHRPLCRGDMIDFVKPEPQTVSPAMTSPPAVRPTTLPIATPMAPISTADFGFDLGSTGVTPIVSASGVNLFLGAGTDFMSPTTLLGSPSSLII